VQSFISQPELSPSLSEEAIPKLVRLRCVRDYRDRFILRKLQQEALLNDPGFPLFDPKVHKAKIAWTEQGSVREAVGYYLYREGTPMRHPSAIGVVQYPRTFSQVFVVPDHRHRGIASGMVLDFIEHNGTEQVYVDSPKKETQALLKKLGYHETPRAYQMWEMLEGLSCWERDEKEEEYLLEPSNRCIRQWVWSGIEGVGLGELR
jgi:GNAT superfamily N-acetyltransferase